MSKKVVVVGGGPAGMMAAWHLAESFEVKLFEKGPQLGRKFLLAGKGGLNITHLADREELKSAYSPFGIMDKVLDCFDQADFRKWLMDLGIPTYEGTSGKVFPEKGMDASIVLKRITDSLLEKSVTIYLNLRLIGFSDDISGEYGDNETTSSGKHRVTNLTKEKPKGGNADKRFTFHVKENGMEESRIMHYDADFAVLALGGASWPLTGSDGRWVEMFREHGIPTLSFQPSNCGVNINWPRSVSEFHAGKPLKNLKISVESNEEMSVPAYKGNTSPDDKEYLTEIGGKPAVINNTLTGTNTTPSDIEINTTNNTISKGEALITDYGLEGTAIYPLIPVIRQKIADGAVVSLVLDFKPLNSHDQLISKINRKKSSSFGRTLSLDSAQMAVIKAFTSKGEFIDPLRFCASVKKLALPVQSLRPVEEAISVVGGIDPAYLQEDFSLRKAPSVYCIGEMVNWDAPTGGYLLQGCFSMGTFVAHMIKKEPHH